MRSAHVLFALAAMLPHQPLAAQDLVGERVRLTTIDDNAVVGRLSRVSADSVVVTTLRKNEPIEVTLSRAAVVSVERSVGRSPDYLRGLGAAAGTVAISLGTAYLLTELVYGDDFESVSVSHPGVLAGLAIGTGLLVAFTRKRDRWAPASLPPAVLPVVRVGDGGGALGLRAAF